MGRARGSGRGSKDEFEGRSQVNTRCRCWHKGESPEANFKRLARPASQNSFGAPGAGPAPTSAVAGRTPG